MTVYGGWSRMWRSNSGTRTAVYHGGDTGSHVANPDALKYRKSTNYRQTLLLYVHFTVVSEYAIVIHVWLLVFLLYFDKVRDSLFGQYMFSQFEETLLGLEE